MRIFGIFRILLMRIFLWNIQTFIDENLWNTQTFTDENLSLEYSGFY